MRKLSIITVLLVAFTAGWGIWGDNALAQELPMIEANISGDWVAAYGVTSGSTAKLEVYAPGETLSKCEEDFDLTVTEEIWMDCWEPMVEPGDLIVLSIDGAPIKSHTAFYLTHDVLDLETGTFAGKADPGNIVRVEYCNPLEEEEWECFSAETETLSSGGWEIIFGADTVLPDAWFGAFISDEDGDQTFAEQTPPPTIDFNLTINFFGANSFPRDSEILVEIYTDETKTELIASETLFTNSHGGAGWDTLLYLETGNFIVTTYGEDEIVKELQLIDLTVDAFDTEADIASGSADAGTVLSVSLEGGDVGYMEVITTATSTGWSVDFGTDYGVDLTEDMDILVCVSDEDWDNLFASLPQLASPPTMMVFPQFDFVQATGWPLGETVTLIIDDDYDLDNGVLYVTTGVSVEAPWNPEDSFIGFNVLGAVDLQPGHILIMFYDDVYQDHVITDLTIGEIGTAADTISGTAAPYSQISVNLSWYDETYLLTTANADGYWVADYSSIADLQHGTQINAGQIDDDGDSTYVTRTIVTEDGLLNDLLNLSEDDIPPQIVSSLFIRIESAFQSLNMGNTNAAIGKLEAIILQIESMPDSIISEETAASLILEIRHLIMIYQ